MKVTSITVTAGRVVNHPYESYSNLRPAITLVATLDEGEDFEQATRELQAKAEGLVEDHKNALLKNLEEIYHLTQKQQEIARLEDGLRRTQRTLDDLRAGLPTSPQLPGVIDSADEGGRKDESW